MNRLWLWIVVVVGLIATVFVVLSMACFLVLPLVMDRLGPKPAGAVLIYEVDPGSLSTGERVNMESLATAIDRRLNAGRGWTKLAQVRQLDGRRIEVDVIRRNAGDTERVEELLNRHGTLEFRILANTRDNNEIIEHALADPLKSDVHDASGNLLAWWVPVIPVEAARFAGDPGIGHRTVMRGGKRITEVLVLNDIYNVTGAYLTSSFPGTDQNGRPCISFTFGNVGAQLFGKLTSTHLPDEQTSFHYLLGIILDGELYSAPRIITTINEHGQITGNFTQDQVQDMANVLNAGSFPARIRLVGKKAAP